MKVLFLFVCIVLLGSCETAPEEIENGEDNYFQVKGFAQGTTYSIIYQDSLERDLSVAIDSLLKDYDSYLSIYLDTSLISRFNQNIIRRGSPITWENGNLENKKNNTFEECFLAAKMVYKNTDGAFDPTVYPLVRYWGFLDKDYEGKSSQSEIDSILSLVNFSDSSIYIRSDTNEKLGEPTRKIYKINVRSRIDFNGIAQGHSVDLIGGFMESLSISNYMVEVGGEILCKGINNSNSLWKIGIDKPIENTSPGEKGLQLILNIDNKAVATSGNYRKFYEKDGVKYSHTINPKSGYPVKHSLLSVTVLTEKCVDADGYATAFMVMGMEKTKQFIANHPNLGLEVYLIASKEDGEYITWMSKGFEKFIN